MRRLDLAFVARLVTAGCVLLISPGVYAAVVQWKVEDGGNGHWYEAVYVPGGSSGGVYWGGITWTAARDAAVARNGWLVDISSAEEDAFVFSLVTPEMWLPEATSSAPLLGPWLGGFQPEGSAEPAGNWQWVTGSTFMDAGGNPTQYTNWYPAQPLNWYQNPGGPAEDALHFYNDTSMWNDYPSWAITLGYIVEYDSELGVVPEPCAVLIWSMLGVLGLTVGRWRRRPTPSLSCSVC